MTKILLVEDNPNYASAAQQYLISRGLDVTLARDYTQAVGKLETSLFDGVITDCFFPEDTGTDKRDIGNSLVEKMALLDLREVKRVEGLKVLGQYIDLEEPALRKYAIQLSDNYGDLTESSITNAIVSTHKLGGKEFASEVARNVFGELYGHLPPPQEYYQALQSAIVESESNQPLGILIAERAAELGIPFVLATSTYHHDTLTQPIQDYATRNRWSLVDCEHGKEDEKATQGFWEKTVQALKLK